MSYSRILPTLIPKKSLTVAILFFSKFAKAEDNKDDTTYILGVGAFTAFLCLAAILNKVWYKPRQEKAIRRRERAAAIEALPLVRATHGVRIINYRSTLGTIPENTTLEEQHFFRRA